MSKYTIQLGEILTNIMLHDMYPSAIELSHISPYSYDTDPYKIVEKTRAKFFDFEYNIYNPSLNKIRLENKLLRHYYDYEICVDMPPKFKFLFKNTLNEIMPYYNAIYKATESEYDPLINIEYEEKTEGEGTNEATNKSKNTLTSETHDEYHDENNDVSKESDTPQGELEDIYDDRYVSNLQHNEGHREGEKDNKIDSETNLDQKNDGKYSNKTNRIITGIDGISKSKLMLEYLKAIQNVDNMIIKDKEIQSLFMQVW